MPISLSTSPRHLTIMPINQGILTTHLANTTINLKTARYHHRYQTRHLYHGSLLSSLSTSPRHLTIISIKYQPRHPHHGSLLSWLKPFSSHFFYLTWLLFLENSWRERVTRFGTPSFSSYSFSRYIINTLGQFRALAKLHVVISRKTRLPGVTVTLNSMLSKVATSLEAKILQKQIHASKWSTGRRCVWWKYQWSKISLHCLFNLTFLVIILILIYANIAITILFSKVTTNIITSP